MPVQPRLVPILGLFLVGGLVANEPDDSFLTKLCRDWSAAYERIQYRQPDRRDAGRHIRYITRQLRELLPVPDDTTLYFPLEGYDISAVGGNGSGFVERDYNFSHGNAHRAHPAHDIFIHDADQDRIDDRTGKPAYVLAMAGGIVVATKSDWAEPDSLRGGNYVVTYDPLRNRYYYYAHNDRLLVRAGDIVRGGQRIATVGRSGRNAAPTRSATHVHLMVIQLSDDRGRPINYFPELKTARITRYTN